jgi:hypothetical protein
MVAVERGPLRVGRGRCQGFDTAAKDDDAVPRSVTDLFQAKLKMED